VAGVSDFLSIGSGSASEVQYQVILGSHKCRGMSILKRFRAFVIFSVFK